MKLLGKNELKSLDIFEEKHSGCYSKYNKTTKYKITITGTGIGLHVKVKCCSCKKSKDISDYDNW